MERHTKVISNALNQLAKHFRIKGDHTRELSCLIACDFIYDLEARIWKLDNAFNENSERLVNLREELKKQAPTNEQYEDRIKALEELNLHYAELLTKHNITEVIENDNAH